MIDSTRKKLREAQFFLAQLEQQQRTHGLYPAEAVEFYLSAFLSAARSVTFVLAAEEPSRYKEWSADWRGARPEEDKRVLARFTDARNRALKRETPNVSEDWLGPSASYDGIPAHAIMAFLEDGELPISDRLFNARLTAGDDEEDVVSLCRQYAGLLADLVATSQLPIQRQAQSNYSIKGNLNRTD
jgi:hypothetical protein